jgi:hypothetical protein
MDAEPIREIKPVVIPAQFFILGPIVSAFVAIFPAGFAFIISNIVGMEMGDPFEAARHGPIVGVGVVVYVLSFLVCMVLLGMKVFNEPERTTYRIYADRIEYYEGLWNRVQRTLVFDQVIDVELSEGILQQTQGAGTITLITQQLVNDGEGHLSNRRITLTNIPEPREVYELIRSLAIKGK